MSMLGLPHHDGSARYVPHQAPGLGETCPVFVRTSASVRTVRIRSVADGEPRYGTAVLDREAGGVRWWRAEVEVRNPVTNYRFLVEDGPTGGGQRWLNARGVFSYDVPDNTDFKLVAYDPPPEWARDAVVYQIFPDRFARSAGAAGRDLPDWAIPCDWDRTPVIGRGPETPYQFYGGDLDGITERLDHLDRLGVNTVYLTPIFPARSNHRYDAAGFDRVDPLLGGDAALARLADAVHGRGWRLLGDITSNHTGDSHQWFVDAISDVGSPEREMYYFDDGGDYESWLGVKSLPKLNWGSAELRRRFHTGPDSVLVRWLRPPYGLDGWRVDVANMTGRRGRDAYTVEVAAALRRAVTDARPDGLVVGEHGHDFTGDLDADGWQGTMNYAGFLRPVWNWLRCAEVELPDFLGVPDGVPRRDGPEVLATMRAFGSLVSWRALTASWLLLGSHDSARIRTVVGDAARQEVAVGLLCTLPGTPMIFAGDELGLTGRNGEDSRTPMPWRRPETWDRSTFDRYRALIALRRSEPALRHGGLRWAYADADSLVFLREGPSGALLVLARRASVGPLRLVGPAPEAGGVEAVNLYGGAPDLRPDPGGGLTLPGDGPTFQVWRVS
ncbi:glycoside hydrolase family 13 protein [Plantactinospora solaniradicis]|uniref:Glycoside hydrolase family 13 protein n=1 Tax=Plantactinospora solaniradicis TaxID=1723736 RepID=A0ABW1JZZ6_9ACTN